LKQIANHVALIIPGLDRIGGAERQVMLLACGLASRGWRVSVIALSGQGRTVALDLATAGVSFLSLGMRKGLADPRGWIRIRNWMMRERPDVVHAHLPHAAWLSRWTRLAAPVRVLIDTLHSSSTGTWGRHLGFRASDWLTDRVTAVSQAVADAHLAAHFTDPRKLAILQNGVELENSSPDPALRVRIRRELGITASGIESALLWLAAGRLEPVKDYPTLLRAFAAAPGKAHLVIAGDGSLAIDLHQLTATLGLQSRVHFLGFCPDLRPWMHSADAFVLSSLWEGLPLALLEAAAAGLPCVATDVPGTRELVHRGQTGFLALPGSAIALQSAMTRMMSLQPAERSAMGQQARKLIEQNFSLKSVLDRWEATYTELLERNPKRTRCSVQILNCASSAGHRIDP
jgi:glycosyltransferase involved in cell wall biosynthesis